MLRKILIAASYFLGDTIVRQIICIRQANIEKHIQFHILSVLIYCNFYNIVFIVNFFFIFKLSYMIGRIEIVVFVLKVRGLPHTHQ
jgi:hypothetical protein